MHDSFSKLNLQRCDDPNGFNGARFDNLYFATALAEEVGEVCGAIKKFYRGFNNRELKKMKAKWKKERKPEDEMPTDEIFKLMWTQKKIIDLAKEMADVNIYLDLLASKNGINLEEVTIKKFNEVSTEMELGNEYLYTDGKYNLPNQDSI